MITFETRYFPTFHDTINEETSIRERRKLAKRTNHTNEYHIYRLDEEDLVFNWCDKWFKDKCDVLNNDKYYYNAIWTVKKVDIETSYHLYNREYNPCSIKIMTSYKDPSTFALKAQMHSVDDSSYGVWFNKLTLDAAETLREKFVKHLDSQKIFNGIKFITFAKELGATEKDIDYN